MYQVSSEQHRSIVSAILRSPVRPPKSMRGLDWRGFLQTYFANVDAKDLADRDPKDLAGRGALASHLRAATRPRGAGAGIQSHVARAWLRLAAHHHRRGQRRHAIPGGFHQSRVDRTCAHAAFARASDFRGDPRPCRNLGRAAKTHRSVLAREAAPGVISASRGRSNRRSGGFEIPGKPDRAQPARCARGMRGLEPHARRGANGGAGFGRDERARRCDRTQRDLRAARLDGESAFHLSRLSRISAQGRQGTRAAAGGQIQRTRHPAARAQETGQQHAGAAQRYPAAKPLAQFELGDQGQFLVHRAPRRLFGLRRHQAIRRPRAPDRRAAFPRPLDLRRVQRQSARDPGVAPENRASIRTLCPGARQPRRQGAAARPGIVSAR